MKSAILIYIALSFAPLGAAPTAETPDKLFRAGSLFQEHMVLQREMAVPVWGEATPGATITVEFGDQKKTTTAGDDTKWRVVLDPLQASFEPRTMTISSSADAATITLPDVLVGEVWICSGQSNMQMGVNRAPKVKALIPKAKNIRSFTVKRTVSLTEQDRCEGKWVDQYPDSAVAFGFSYFLEHSTGMPVGIILSCWGSSSLEAWMPRDMEGSVPHFKTLMKEFDANTANLNKINAILAGTQPWGKSEDIFLRQQHNILYNAMMHPLAPYACRGLVWYQGERNATSLTALSGKGVNRTSGMLIYGDVLKQWIQRYRKQWQQEDLEFLLVMLPGFGQTLASGPDQSPQSPIAHSWAWMREAQMKALELPHTAIANTIDLGNLKNIHPNDKLPIGERLALLASRDTPGSSVIPKGPVMKNVDRNGNSLIVHYEHAAGLMTRDAAPPSGFWLADESGKWVPAKAEIRGQTVVLRSEDLSKPLYVRYAFSAMPAVNLVNGADLPAYPFRTDSFQP